MNDEYQERFFNALALLSFYISLLNLEENREQSAHNDVQVANDKQAEYLLNKINYHFDKQNKILEEQNIVLNKLLELLGENSNEN